tara:strand:+ start:168 stop:902 length:735 start_codon:yes stop_codon:yes gene_type:complete
MATCGINVSMSSLQGELTSKVSGFLNLKGSLGKPGGIGALSGVLSGGLDGIKGSVTAMLPSIPISTSAFSSLRNDLNSVVQSAGGGLTDFLTKYAGLTGLSGYANLNLNDLAQSALSLSASFDPCSIDIPNILADADGNLESQADSAPSHGATVLAGKNIFPDQSFTDLFAESQKNITTLVTTMSTPEAQAAINSNLQQAKTFSDGAIRRGLDGIDTLMLQDDLRSLLEGEATNMIDEETMTYV